MAIRGRGGVKKVFSKRASPAARASLTAGSALDLTIDIGKKKQITVHQYNGISLVDIREFYEKDGEILPGKKGISLSQESWELLLKNAQKIDQALSAFAEKDSAIKKAKEESKEESKEEEPVATKIEESDTLPMSQDYAER
ncbi:hypothetical protein BABINDRAFT_6342 [Babjeviella inositovora NRRL Y-12698]|uniref:Transcriptional coactivator p15 (PC4) C-terminal domain-containing protein n=1 Tax=Babjeviella inositovora NRRL Y-12698 TaxID=984486 RepID=A0A1E3QVI4_9ASCO|nr:uncharacterized protein BABINDRAFT_6342 [Babjeviella inositovora NRRL Y-12698]ODQ81675.1 hypothetical protein BABINDRAFT_6342 [Babjeviella inositovora NRRL Y-12698]